MAFNMQVSQELLLCSGWVEQKYAETLSKMMGNLSPEGEGECALRGLPDSSSTRLAPNHLPLFRHALTDQESKFLAACGRLASWGRRRSHGDPIRGGLR